jgi:hypothetical protein
MSPKHYASIIASLLLLSVTPAQANHEHDGYPFYGGFAIGISGADEDCDYHGYDCDGNDTSFKFYGGKRFHENIAIEVSYQDLGKLDDDQGAVTTTAESSGVNLSLLGIIPVSELGYFYGKAGVMAWETDYTRIGTTTTTTDDDGTDFTFGVCCGPRGANPRKARRWILRKKPASDTGVSRNARDGK